jgi:hypothetical protein
MNIFSTINRMATKLNSFLVNEIIHILSGLRTCFFSFVLLKQNYHLKAFASVDIYRITKTNCFFPTLSDVLSLVCDKKKKLL